MRPCALRLTSFSGRWIPSSAGGQRDIGARSRVFTGDREVKPAGELRTVCGDIVGQRAFVESGFCSYLVQVARSLLPARRMSRPSRVRKNMARRRHLRLLLRKNCDCGSKCMKGHFYQDAQLMNGAEHACSSSKLRSHASYLASGFDSDLLARYGFACVVLTQNRGVRDDRPSPEADAENATEGYV